MVTQTAPSGQNESSGVVASPKVVGGSIMVEPDGRVLSATRTTTLLASLLPIDPPEIDSLVTHILQHDIFESIDIAGIHHREGNGPACLGVETQIAREGIVSHF